MVQEQFNRIDELLNKTDKILSSEGTGDANFKQISTANDAPAEIIPEVVEFHTEIVALTPQRDAEIMQMLDQIQSIVAYANERSVISAESVKEATNDLGAISRMKKAIEEARQKWIAPLNTTLKEYNAFFKTLSDPILEADKITRNKILAYNAEIERKRQEAERIEAEKLRLAREEEALKGEHTVDLTPVEKPEATPERVRATIGMASKMEVWKFEVVDFSIVPDEYKVVDTAMLNSIARKHHDKKPIPGIRFYPEQTLRVST